MLLRYNGFTGIQKAIVDQTGSKPPNSDHDLFLGSEVQVCLYEVLWNIWVQLLIWLSLIVYKIHFSSHVTIQLRNNLMLLCRIKEDNTSKLQFLKSAFNSWDTHLPSFFTSPVWFKCQMTIEWSMLSSLASSHVLVRGSASMDPLSWLLSTSDGQPMCSLSLRLSSLQSFSKHQGTAWFISSSWVKHIIDVASFLHCFITHFELK